MTVRAPVWDDARWAPHGAPRLVGNVQADVCVVGLGGSGLSCIGRLIESGRTVIGVDAGAVAAGAAGRNGGFLLAGTMHFYHQAAADSGPGAIGRARAREFYRRTLREIDRLTERMPDVVRRTGSLRIAGSDEEVNDCRLQLAAMREDDLPVEWYEGAEGTGLHFPRDAAFQPVGRARTLAAQLRARGVRLFENSPVLAVDCGGVETAIGRVDAEVVVVAVDGRLESILPELRGRVRTARLQMLATAPTDEVRIARPVYRRWGYDYWQQLPDGRIVLGGARDAGGESEWTMDTTPTAAVQDALDECLRRVVGVQHAPVTHRWAASAAYTPTNLPVVEQVRPGVWALGAYSGTGNVIGAIAGRAVAERICGEPGESAEALALLLG